MEEKYRNVIRKLIPSELLNSLVNIYSFLTLQVYRLGNKAIFLRSSTSDFQVFRQIFVQKDYDIFSKDFNPKVIVDCGANIGLSALFFSQKYADAQIVAVEPESGNFEILQKNINGRKNIKAYKYAIWNRNCFLKIESSDLGEWGFTTKEVKNKRDADVEAVTIDKIMRINNLKSIDLLKIDIEGAEKEVFEQGYEKWLPFVDCLIIELHDRFKDGCEDCFNKAIERYNFSKEICGENIILRKQS